MIGLNVHVPTDKMLESVANAGVHHVRVDFLPSLKTRVYDRMLRKCEELAINILAVPANDTSLSEMRLMVERHGWGVEAWQLGNEPNNPKYWDGTRGEWFTKVAQWSRLVRDESPKATIVGTPMVRAGDWRTWLRQFLEFAAGGHIHMDAAAANVYPSGASWLSYWERMKNPLPCRRGVLREMRRHGWNGPVWVTETGVATDREGFYPQAGYIRRVAERPLVDRVYLYEYQDDASGLYPLYGLRHADGVPKPGWWAMARAGEPQLCCGS